MFEYELHTMHHAELVAEAAAHRLAHEAPATHKGLRLFGIRLGATTRRRSRPTAAAVASPRPRDPL
ncbi:hypothetical protein O1L60_27165 [Streptomyces diastatochromogenes]|nr:hypothetical protein [Streptomyces diastatochromogenes]